MSLHRLTTITIGVPNVADTAQYYAEWGLAREPSSETAREVAGEPAGDGIKGSAVRGCAGHAGHDPLLQQCRSTEENLPLVGEVPEESAFGQPRPDGDLRGGGLVESPL